MAKEGIKTGDVVQLKSGGLEMTVGEFHNSILTVCYWFDKNKDLKKEYVPVDALEVVKVDDDKM